MIICLDEALNKKDTNILVHCSAGISRSPTLVLAYMIKRHHLTLDEAFDKMRQLRPIVDPNVSFILQLRDWEKSLLTSTESSEDHSCTSTASAGTRSSSSTTATTYCGSSSKSKNESKTRSDSSAIPVS